MPVPSKADRVAREIADSCIAMRCRRLSRQITRLYDEAMREHGIKTSQVNILVAVARRKGARPRDLAEALQLDVSTFSRNARLMRECGWIEEIEEADARSRPLKITAKGSALLVSIAADWKRAQRQADRWLGPGGIEFLDTASTRATKP